MAEKPLEHGCAADLHFLRALMQNEPGSTQLERGGHAAQINELSRLAGFHIVAKPVGPICNLDCQYCFYLQKEKLYPKTSNWMMAEDVLESYIRQYIEAQGVPVITFAWQGGESQCSRNGLASRCSSKLTTLSITRNSPA